MPVSRHAWKAIRRCATGVDPKHMLPLRTCSMAITLRNKKVEDQIRALGRETGEGPSAVIARAIAAETERARAEKERTVAERLARMRAFRATLPKLSEEEKKAVWEEADRMFDYLYEDEQRD